MVYFFFIKFSNVFVVVIKTFVNYFQITQKVAEMNRGVDACVNGGSAQLRDSPRGLHSSLEGGLDDIDLLKIGSPPPLQGRDSVSNIFIPIFQFQNRDASIKNIMEFYHININMINFICTRHRKKEMTPLTDQLKTALPNATLCPTRKQLKWTKTTKKILNLQNHRLHPSK